jgi:hypothetical protein
MASISVAVEAERPRDLQVGIKRFKGWYKEIQGLAKGSYQGALSGAP